MLIVLYPFRSPFYEVFSKIHYFLAVAALAVIWRHLLFKSVFARFYIYAAASLLAITSSACYIQMISRNVTRRHSYASTSLLQINDAVYISISVPRPWRLRAGQYIYLWIPTVSFWSFLQTHPFAISWWDNNIDSRGSTIYLLVKPKSGFTHNLLRHVGGPSVLTWIDEPYGRYKDLGDYGSILMFTSGIGIAAQVPYIKELLQGFKEFRVRTRSILLIWQLDRESKQNQTYLEK